MLGKQRRNQVADQKFMESAWENMAETLDVEMPVEKEQRRIGWLSIAAILVIGFVGGITVMWGLQKHDSAPMAAKEIINTTGETDIATSEVQKEENPILTPNNSNYSSNTTLNNTTTTSDSEKTVNNNLAAATPKKKQTFTKSIIKTESDLGQNNSSQKPVMQNASTISVSTQNTQEAIIAAAEVTSINTIQEMGDRSTPVSGLPTLGLTALPTVNTGFSIDNDLDLPKNKKWRTGAYVGAIVAGKTNNGLEVGVRGERKLGAKWAVKTGLGFRVTQLAIVSKNVASENLAFEDANFGDQISGPDSLERSISASQEIANRINADAPNYQLTVPLSLVYRPMGKLRLALGISWAYRLNKLKEVSSFINPSTGSFTNSAESFANSSNSFTDRLGDFRLNFGIGYYLNPCTGIELAYSEGLTSKGNSDDLYADSNDSSDRFFQIGLIHYFGK